MKYTENAVEGLLLDMRAFGNREFHIEMNYKDRESAITATHVATNMVYQISMFRTVTSDTFTVIHEINNKKNTRETLAQSYTWSRAKILQYFSIFLVKRAQNNFRPFPIWLADTRGNKMPSNFRVILSVDNCTATVFTETLKMAQHYGVAYIQNAELQSSGRLITDYSKPRRIKITDRTDTYTWVKAQLPD